MIRITHERRDAILQLMTEGMSISAIARCTGSAKTTILRLINSAGLMAWAYHDKFVRGLRCSRLEIDETWSFVGMKRKNVPIEKRGSLGNGDVWNWTALDAASRFLVAWMLADHSSQSANDFMRELRGRVVGDFEISTDGLTSYPRAIDVAFGPYAMRPVDRSGSSTNHVERWNLTLRMGNRRFTRSTNGFSKSLRNHFFTMAIFAFHYNFIRVNRAVNGTPAMALGLIGRPMTFDDLYTAVKFDALDLQTADAICDEKFKVETAKIYQWGASSNVREYVLIRGGATA